MNKFSASYALRWQILERDSFTCQYCGQHAPDVKLEVDHVIPREDGGSDSPANLKTSCYACNRGRSGFTIQTKHRGLEHKTKFETPIRTAFNKLIGESQEITPALVAEQLDLKEAYARVLICRAVKKNVLKHTKYGRYSKP